MFSKDIIYLFFQSKLGVACVSVPRHLYVYRVGWFVRATQRQTITTKKHMYVFWMRYQLFKNYKGCVLSLLAPVHLQLASPSRPTHHGTWSTACCCTSGKMSSVLHVKVHVVFLSVCWTVSTLSKFVLRSTTSLHYLITPMAYYRPSGQWVLITRDKTVYMINATCLCVKRILKLC